MSIASRLRGTAPALALAFALAAPLPAAAQAPALPSADGARAVAEAVRDWLTRQFGGKLDVSTLPLKVTAEGETYRLELPLGGTWFDNNVTIADAVAAITVKPLEGGRWEVVGGTLPPRLSAEMKDKSGEPARMTMTLENQQTTGVYDPSLATASNFVSTITGYTTETQTKVGTQTSRVGKLVGRSEWSPTAPGRATIQGDSMLEGYSTSTPLPGGEPMKVTIARMGGATRIENFNIDGLGILLRTAFELGTAAKEAADAAKSGSKSESGKSGDAKAAPPPDKATAMKLLGLVSSMMDALETDYSYEDIKVEGGTMFSGSLRRFGMGLTAGAPDGKLDVKLRMALEGLESPMIPAGPWLEFIPHKLTLTPRVGGVPKEAVMTLLRRAIDTEGKNIDTEALELLAAYPATVAIEDLLFDVGPMRLKGEGSLEVASITEATGEAELRASGFDALIRRVSAVPELKSAAPVLVFLKGIAKQEGTETVWHITYSDGKVTVNDTDLSDLMPSK